MVKVFLRTQQKKQPSRFCNETSLGQVHQTQVYTQTAFTCSVSKDLGHPMWELSVPVIVIPQCLGEDRNSLNKQWNENEV